MPCIQGSLTNFQQTSAEMGQHSLICREMWHKGIKAKKKESPGAQILRLKRVDQEINGTGTLVEKTISCRATTGGDTRGKQGTGNKAQGNLTQLTTKEKVDGYQHEHGADTAWTVYKSGCVDANRGSVGAETKS